MTLIHSVSGVRGIVGQSLIPPVVMEYAAAFAHWAPEGTIAVGRDGRWGGQWIETLVVGTLQAMGRSVVKFGVVPTPTVQWAVEHDERLAGGVVITASHNPAEWNGLKFLNAQGVFLSQDENEQLKRYVESHTAGKGVVWNQVRSVQEHLTIQNDHIDAVMRLPVVAQQLENIRQRRYTIVVDAVNAAGSEIVPRLLEQMGCKVIPLYCEGSGYFPHPPEPLPSHLSHLCQAVQANKADLGVAVDPDGDRLVLVDDRGTAVWEEYTIVLAAMAIMEMLDVHNVGYQPVVVVNLSTTAVVEEVACRYGWQVQRSPVGEINVVSMMKAVNAAIGGEGSGGVIFPACHYGRDALVGIGLILSLLTQRGQSLSQLVARLPKRVMQKHKVTAPEIPFSKVAERIMTLFPEASVDRSDGVKLSWSDRWIHLRPSNTEPVLRVIVEASTTAAVELLLRTVQKVWS